MQSHLTMKPTYGSLLQHFFLHHQCSYEPSNTMNVNSLFRESNDGNMGFYSTMLTKSWGVLSKD